MAHLNGKWHLVDGAVKQADWHYHSAKNILFPAINHNRYLAICILLPACFSPIALLVDGDKIPVRKGMTALSHLAGDNRRAERQQLRACFTLRQRGHKTTIKFGVNEAGGDGARLKGIIFQHR